MNEPTRHSLRKSVSTHSARYEVLEERRMLTGVPELLKDIAPVDDGAFMRHGPDFVAVGDLAYFVADDGEHGNEVWVTDGTTEGTRLLRDISPDTNMNGQAPSQLISAGGKLYFLEAAGTSSTRLWMSDGTEVGTVPVPGATRLDVTGLTNVGDQVYFGTYGGELWTTDGTADGTHRVRTLTGSVTNLYAAESSLYILTSYNYGVWLWFSDGTELGTNRVGKFGGEIPSKQTSSPTTAGNKFYYTNFVPGVGSDLWCSDGTLAGTFRVAELAAEITAVDSQSLTAAGGLLYFTANAEDGTDRLWVTDGTVAGTHLGVEPTAGLPIGSIWGLTEYHGGLAFLARGGDQPTTIWQVDERGVAAPLVGTSTGQQLEHMSSLAISGDTIYFRAIDFDGQSGLWKSDGTSAGTQLVSAIDDQLRSISNPYVFNDRYLFTTVHPVYNEEVWIFDGSAAGIHLLKNVNQIAYEDAEVHGFTDVDGRAFFVAQELWVSDGTRDGTMMVKDIWPGEYTSDIDNLTNVGGVLYFSANDGIHGTELWKSDGTEAGTVLVKDLFSDGSSNPHNLTDIAGTLYFTADDGQHGYELWKSDGTAEGTVLVIDLQPGPIGSNPTELLNAAGKLYFVADDGVGGAELWQSDGSSSGTQLVKDINAGGSSNPASLVFHKGRLYFSADDGVHGTELWCSDGTDEGTYLLKDLTPGGADSHSVLSNFVSAGEKLFFASKVAGTTHYPHRIWVSDGTSEGTAQLPGTFLLSGPLTALGENLIIPDTEDLMVTNGAFDGRKLLRSTRAYEIVVADGIAYCATNGGIVRTDGTLEGTHQFDIPRPNDSHEYNDYDPYPRGLASSGGNVYFNVFSPIYGRDAWIIPRVPKPAVVSNHFFYNNSVFDDYTPGPSAADDDAIAPYKVAYQWYEHSSTGNATNYSRGINGIMIDTVGMPDLRIEDFRFQVRVNYVGYTFTWNDAPAPSYFSIRPGDGDAGSDRIALIWPDGAIKNTWLRVIVRGNDLTGEYNTHSGLAKSEVLHFGNSIGNTLELEMPGEYYTDKYDAPRVFSHLGASVGVESPYDFNRDGKINTTDAAIVMANFGGELERLRWINNFPDIEEIAEPLPELPSDSAAPSARFIASPAVGTFSYRDDQANVANRPVSIVRQSPPPTQVRQATVADLVLEEDGTLFEEEDDLGMLHSLKQQPNGPTRLLCGSADQTLG